MQHIVIETPRFYIREVQMTDVPEFFALDSDPAVHQYLGNHPVTDIAQSEAYVKDLIQSYANDGMCRWAVIDKQDGAFVGWSGIRYETTVLSKPYYDIGYRLKAKYWGKGIATETAQAVLNYGFAELKLPKIMGFAHVDNVGSNRVLRKIGLQYEGIFHYSAFDCYQYALSREEWLTLKESLSK
ncbi:MAG: GNAT family N-acetyltransferase [Saprospiraceae bacterium]